MKPFVLTVASPDGIQFQGEIVKLDVRGVEGELAVMAGHAPFVTSLKEAPITIWMDAATKRTASSRGGILTVGKEKAVLLSSSFRLSEN